MAAQNINPKEVRVLQVQSPARDILFYERTEAAKYRDNHPLPAMGTAHPMASRWPNHELCGITEDGEEGWLRFYYMADRAAQEVYNFEYAEEIDGEYPTVRQTWVMKRAAYAPGAIAAPPSLGGRTWSYQGESQQRTDPTTDGLFVTVIHTWWDVSSPRVGYDVDPETGELRAVTRQVETRVAATGQAVNSLGSYREVRPINRLWSEMTTRFLPGLAGAASKSRVWESFEPWSWPGVLESIFVGAIPAPAESEGAVAKYVWYPVWKRPRYRGPCKITITEVWSQTAPVLDDEEVLLEREIRFSGGMLYIDIEPCLHAALTITEGTSVETEQFGAYTFSIPFPATVPADWPATIVGRVEVTRANGGYLKRTMLIDRPAVAGADPDIVLTMTGAVESEMGLSWSSAIVSPEYFIEVSKNANFAFDFVAGYNPYDAGSEMLHTVPGLEVGMVYYARVTHRPGGGAVLYTSNTVVGVVGQGPVIQVWDETGSPVRRLNGASQSLGSVTPPATVTANMNVRNTGSYALVITSVAIEDATGGTWLCSLTAQTIAAGADVDFTLSFEPDGFSPGFQYATLRILSQTPADGDYVLNLEAEAL